MIRAIVIIEIVAGMVGVVLVFALARRRSRRAQRRAEELFRAARANSRRFCRHCGRNVYAFTTCTLCGAGPDGLVDGWVDVV